MDTLEEFEDLIKQSMLSDGEAILGRYYIGKNGKDMLIITNKRMFDRFFGWLSFSILSHISCASRSGTKITYRCADIYVERVFQDQLEAEEAFCLIAKNIPL